MKRLFCLLLFFVIVQMGGVTTSLADEKGGEEEKLEVLHRQISFFEDGLQEKPLDPNFHFQLGTKYYLLGQFYENNANRILFTSDNDLDRKRAHDLYLSSIEHLEKSLEIHPNNAGAHFNLSLTHFVEGDAENAIVHMRESEKLFMDLQDKRGVAKARKALREWFDRYGYRPEDFSPLN